MNWIADYIEGHGEEFWQRALKIHGYAELAGEERQSAAELCAMLEQAGFAVEQGLGSQPTAFRAVYGSGGPVIGFLCEYDALPKLNQTEGTCYNGDGRSGHGCGHNLLGVGAAAAAMALREEMEKGGLSGTLVVYGCPAEETLFGKTKMAEEGYFKELDVALAWHPEDHYCCGEVCHKAMDSIRFRFHGRSAHASVCPELGRSALDGAEMMSVGANYLREHVPDGVRIHYSYLSAGEKPNVVPDFAEVWYFVRSNRRRIVDQVTERLIQVARGAAMMSGTEVEWKFLARGNSTRINTTLASWLTVVCGGFRCRSGRSRSCSWRPVWGRAWGFRVRSAGSSLRRRAGSWRAAVPRTSQQSARRFPRWRSTRSVSPGARRGTTGR